MVVILLIDWHFMNVVRFGFKWQELWYEAIKMECVDGKQRHAINTNENGIILEVNKLSIDG